MYLPHRHVEQSEKQLSRSLLPVVLTLMSLKSPLFLAEVTLSRLATLPIVNAAVVLNINEIRASTIEGA
jgi:hypothetical protein